MLPIHSHFPMRSFQKIALPPQACFAFAIAFLVNVYLVAGNLYAQNPGTRLPAAYVAPTTTRFGRLPNNNTASNNAASSSASNSSAAAAGPVQYGSYALRQLNSAANNNNSAANNNGPVNVAPVSSVPPILLGGSTYVVGPNFVGVSLAQQQGQVIGAAQAKASGGPTGNDAASALSQSSSASQGLGQGTGINGGYVETVIPPPEFPHVAVQVTLGFEPKVVTPSVIGLAIAKRLRTLPSLHFVTPVQVDFEGRTAILRGTVATKHDRDLAERVVMLESSVDDVLNQLVIETARVPPPPLPQGR